MSKQAFVLVSTAYGPMIVNRMDFLNAGDGLVGVSVQLLATGKYDHHEGSAIVALLMERRSAFGDGVLVLDIGANIGVRTIQWAKLMTGWGEVRAFEPQLPLFNALCGNIALNNCFNAKADCLAIGSDYGSISVPVPDYTKPGNFGGLELRDRGKPGGWYREYIGQTYDEMGYALAPMVKIDGMSLERLDLMKIDVEGMELEVLEGTAETIDRLHPIIVAEAIKVDKLELREWLEQRSYTVVPLGLNLLGIHADDPVHSFVSVAPPNAGC